MRDRQGFILVYDITNRSSVEELNDLYIQILRNKLISPNKVDGESTESVIPLVLVGNKLDLAIERKVSSTRGEELARQWRCPHYETSAKNRTNVDEIFYDLVGQIIKGEDGSKNKKVGVVSEEGQDGVKEDIENDDDTVGVGCCSIV
jgi:GTPase SAR1 family protein